jgi:APA family basic amino acid/polyamine antiporter
VIGLAAGAAGPAIVISILLAGGVAGLTAAAAARLGTIYPVAGGTYEYAYRLLSPGWGFIAGWTWLASAAIASGAVALTLGAYLHALLPFVPIRWGGVTFMLTVTGVNLLGARLARRIVDLLVAVKLAILFVFIGIGVVALRIEHYAPFAPAGPAGVIKGTALIFFAYVGIEQSSKLGE